MSTDEGRRSPLPTIGLPSLHRVGSPDEWTREAPTHLDWSGDIGDDIRAFLAKFGIVETDGIQHTVSTISDRIRDDDQLMNLTELMERQSHEILNSRLRLEDCFTTQFCPSSFAAIQLILFAALHHRFPSMESEGYVSIGSRQPVIYISASFGWQSSLLQACSWLLLPTANNIRVIPGRLDEAGPFPAQTMDCSLLCEAIDEDKQSGRMPLCVFASLSTTVYRDSRFVHRNDDIARIRQICDVNGLWLHVNGADLHFVSSMHRPKAVAVAIDAADSFMIRPKYLVVSGSQTHIVMIRSTHLFPLKESLLPPPSYDLSAPLFLLLSSIASELQTYTDSHLTIVRHLFLTADRDDHFRLEASHHTEIRPTFLIVPTAVTLTDLDLTLQIVNGLVLEGLTINNCKSSVMYDPEQSSVMFAIRPPTISSTTPILPTSGDVDVFLGEVERRVAMLEQGIGVRPLLRSLIQQKQPFLAMERDMFSLPVGLVVFRLLPGFIAVDQAEAANCLNDCLAKSLWNKSNVFRGCLADDGTAGIAVLSIPEQCLGDSDEHVARRIVEMIVETQSQITYPPAVIEVLSRSLQTGIVEAEDYLREMQNQSFSPMEMIRSMPLIGSVIGWLLNKNGDDDGTAAAAAALVGQSFDLESRSLSRRSADPGTKT